MGRRVCTFAIAHTDITTHPFNNASRTVRVFVPNNLDGTGIIVKFSNYESSRPVWVKSATIGVTDAKGNLLKDTIRLLTVNGDTSFALVPQRDAFSDEVPMEVKAGQTLAVSLYYPLSDKVTSGNFVGVFAQRSVKGDFTTEPDMRAAQLLRNLSRSVLPWDLTSPITTLSEVIVVQPDDAPAPRVVAAFGDSIMQQGAWVTPFTARLYERYRGAISVCNLGIGGNRLLHHAPDSTRGLYGHAGIDRYHHTLMTIEGLTHVIFALGTNDIGLPGGGAPESELITLSQYSAGVTALVQDLRKRGVKIFAGKLLPREINAVYTKEREALRLSINDWLESCGLFDAVLDLGAPIADLSDGIGMQKEYALPDGLHPNLAGGKKIAESIDLELFA